MVAIRPQGVCLTLASETAPGTPGRIMTRHFLGEIDLFDVAVEGFESYLVAKARAGDGLVPGAEVRVSFDPRDILVFPHAEAQRD
jgi:iron(III) transport system ATP-binding protein